MKLLTTSLALAVALSGCTTQVVEEADLEAIDTESAAFIINTNQTGTNNGYYYTYWKDGGSVNMDLLAGGQYSTSWVAGSYNFVGGKGWSTGSQRTVNYNAGIWSPGSSNAFLTVYGWLQNPLIEYYIVDSWGSWRPVQGTHKGTVSCDGGSYDVYQAQRVNAPSIEGTRTFYQWWSVRQTKRTMGSNVAVNTSCHFNFWRSKGLSVGTWNYMVMATEVFNPASNGSSNLTVW